MKKSIPTSYGRVVYIDSCNHKPPIIFIHGNSSCKEAFSKQLDSRLATTHRLIAIDLLGHGESDNATAGKPEDTYTIGNYAQLVNEFIDLLSLDEPVLVGWSLGGHIALEVAAQLPETIKALVITGTPPLDPGGSNIEIAFHANEAMALTSKKEFTEQDANTYAAATLGGESLVTPELLNMVRRTDGDSRHCVLADWAAPGAGNAATEFIAKWERPICVIHGNKDLFVSLDYIKHLSWKNLWGGHIVTIDEAGHAPFFEEPALFNEILENFFSSFRDR